MFEHAPDYGAKTGEPGFIRNRTHWIEKGEVVMGNTYPGLSCTHSYYEELQLSTPWTAEMGGTLEITELNGSWPISSDMEFDDFYIEIGNAGDSTVIYIDIEPNDYRTIIPAQLHVTIKNNNAAIVYSGTINATWALYHAFLGNEQHLFDNSIDYIIELDGVDYTTIGSDSLGWGFDNGSRFGVSYDYNTGQLYFYLERALYEGLEPFNSFRICQATYHKIDARYLP